MSVEREIKIPAPGLQDIAQLSGRPMKTKANILIVWKTSDATRGLQYTDAESQDDDYQADESDREEDVYVEGELADYIDTLVDENSLTSGMLPGHIVVIYTQQTGEEDD
jgi:hypothetical protein